MEMHLHCLAGSVLGILRLPRFLPFSELLRQPTPEYGNRTQRRRMAREARQPTWPVLVVRNTGCGPWFICPFGDLDHVTTDIRRSNLVDYVTHLDFAVVPNIVLRQRLLRACMAASVHILTVGAEQ